MILIGRFVFCFSEDVPVRIEDESTQISFRCIDWGILGFIIHDKVIEIDPKRIKSIKTVQSPKFKKDL